jgi:hypothetical protein
VLKDFCELAVDQRLIKFANMRGVEYLNFLFMTSEKHAGLGEVAKDDIPAMKRILDRIIHKDITRALRLGFAELQLQEQR